MSADGPLRREHAVTTDLNNDRPEWAYIVIVPTSSLNCLPGKRIRVCRSAQSWPVAERQDDVGWQVAAGHCAEDVHGASDRPRVEFGSTSPASDSKAATATR